MAKCSCTHKLLDTNCFEKVVSHNLQFWHAVTMTIKHEYTNACCLVIGKRQEGILMMMMMMMTVMMMMMMMISVEHNSLNLICY